MFKGLVLDVSSKYGSPSSIDTLSDQKTTIWYFYNEQSKTPQYVIETAIVFEPILSMVIHYAFVDLYLNKNEIEEKKKFDEL